jgi:hypothetical protein
MAEIPFKKTPLLDPDFVLKHCLLTVTFGVPVAALMVHE